MAISSMEGLKVREGKDSVLEGVNLNHESQRALTITGTWENTSQARSATQGSGLIVPSAKPLFPPLPTGLPP